MDICKLIIKDIENKYPANVNGDTPLHWAAIACRFSICKLIVENVENKQPINDFGNTPKDSPFILKTKNCQRIPPETTTVF